MITVLIIGVGLFLLIVLAIGVGASLDVTAQRRVRQHVAHERRMLAEATAEWQDQRRDLCRSCSKRLESRKPRLTARPYNGSITHTGSP